MSRLAYKTVPTPAACIVLMMVLLQSKPVTIKQLARKLRQSAQQTGRAVHENWRKQYLKRAEGRKPIRWQPASKALANRERLIRSGIIARALRSRGFPA